MSEMTPLPPTSAEAFDLLAQQDAIIEASANRLPDDEEARAVSTTQLKQLLVEARVRDYNRKGPDDLPALLRRHERHLIYPLIWHEFADGKPVEPHLRCRVLMHTLGGRAEILLDIHPTTFRRLPLAPSPRKRSGPPAKWQSLLDLQAELVNGLESPIGAASVGQLMHVDDLTVLPAEKSYALADQVRRATPFFVSDEMTDLVEVAAESIGDWHLDLGDLVATNGFAVFERAIESLPWVEEDDMVPLRALSWSLFPSVEGTPGLALVAYADTVTDSDALGSELTKWFPVGQRWWPFLVTTWPLGQGALEPTVTDDKWRPPVKRLRTLAAALWLLSNQRVALVTSHRPPRSERRRAARLDLPSEVRIVTLRRPAQRHEGEGEARHVEWSHRWLVTGHWRRLWDETQLRERLVWVSPYVKGPDDKPFIPKKTLYRFDR